MLPTKNWEFLRNWLITSTDDNYRFFTDILPSLLSIGKPFVFHIKVIAQYSIIYGETINL